MRRMHWCRQRPSLGSLAVEIPVVVGGKIGIGALFCKIDHPVKVAFFRGNPLRLGWKDDGELCMLLNLDLRKRFEDPIFIYRFNGPGHFDTLPADGRKDNEAEKISQR